MMMSSKPYIGIDKDCYGGMRDIGKLIRDAWAFGLIPPQETCAGWDAGKLEQLWQQVNGEWSRYNFRVNDLPGEIRERYLRIQQQAVDTARQAGWDAERYLEDD